MDVNEWGQNYPWVQQVTNEAEDDPGGGVTQVWFSQAGAAAKFESRPMLIPIFQEKVTHSYTNRPKLWAKF